MIGLMEVTKCLGCGEVFCGASLCPDCVRLDALYESKRQAKARMLDREEMLKRLSRTDIGVVFYAGTEKPHLAPVLALLAGAVIGIPMAMVLVWHFGRMLIPYLAGAR